MAWTYLTTLCQRLTVTLVCSHETWLLHGTAHCMVFMVTYKATLLSVSLGILHDESRAFHVQRSDLLLNKVCTGLNLPLDLAKFLVLKIVLLSITLQAMYNFHTLKDMSKL